MKLFVAANQIRLVEFLTVARWANAKAGVPLSIPAPRFQLQKISLQIFYLFIYF